MSESDNSSWENKSYYSSEDLKEYEETEQDETSEEDYEEEQRKPKEIYNIALKKYNIDIDIKTVIAKKIKEINIKNMNYTLLIASMVILAKNSNKIDNNFSPLCDEVIETIIKPELNIEEKKTEINQLKRDILRYCRFVQSYKYG
jgi:hypothetical protein